MERGRNAKFSWPAVVLIVLIVCAISYLLALGISKGGSNALGNCKVLSLSSNQGVQVTSQGFVYYDGGSLGMVNAQGNTRWSYMIGAGCDFCATDAGVAAWNGNTLTLIEMDKGVTTYSGTMEGKIISAKMGEKYSAVVVEAEENDSTIILLDASGRKMTPYIEMEEQMVVDYGFFSGGTLFWELSLDASGTAPTTKISTYQPGRSHRGNITNTDQVLYRVLFQSSRILCVGETYVKAYDYMGTENTAARQLVYGWYLADADAASENPLMAFAANAQYDGGSSIQDVRLMRGEESQIVRFPFGCKALSVRGDRVYGFSTEGYVMIAQLGKQRVLAYQLPVGMDEVYGVTKDNTAILGFGNDVYLVSLP